MHLFFTLFDFGVFLQGEIGGLLIKRHQETHSYHVVSSLPLQFLSAGEGQYPVSISYSSSLQFRGSGPMMIIDLDFVTLVPTVCFSSASSVLS